MVKGPIVKEGYRYIAILACLTACVVIVMGAYWSIIPGVFLVFVTFFFRNPNRKVPGNETYVMSPADGKVMSVCDIYDEEFLLAEAIKVTIFLSVLDVHVNRSPIAGEIIYQQYTCGRFRPAYKESAGCENERHSLGIENDQMKILVTQIAGILARRIVSWVTLGNVLTQGERYGMIKFGSCTEVVMPKSVEVLVKKGDRVRGGETIIGRIRK
jgi:phosphatidylserine decarboxylase